MVQTIKNLDDILERNNANELLKEIFNIIGLRGFVRESIMSEILIIKEYMRYNRYDKEANKRRDKVEIWKGEERSRLGRKLNKAYYEIFDQSRKA